MRKPSAILILVFSVLSISQGARHAGAAPAPAPGARHARFFALLRKRVRYVFVLYQENRSFDSYFGTFPHADGLFSQPADQTPGFEQKLMDARGRMIIIRPFRIGAPQGAADTDDVDHSHSLTVAKMDVRAGRARMDRFALSEERKYSPTGTPSLKAEQFGELTMAYEDCDTIPLLWSYAHKFVLFDHIFEDMAGPSTPGNLSIIAAQTGQTQWARHPSEAWKGDGDSSPGEPVLNDFDPLFGSPKDHGAEKLPVNPADFEGAHRYKTQINQTYASLPLTMAGGSIAQTVKKDADPHDDLADVSRDISAIAARAQKPFDWRWYQEGFDREPTDAPAHNDGPRDAEGRHASYITHHNGPQYFGYVANNPLMRAHLRGLNDFFEDLQHARLPSRGGLFYVKGGYRNIMGMKPTNPDPAVQKKFRGDDDHPGYSDAQISEAMVASAVNAIAASPYWTQSAIIITWDDSEGDYDHVPPPIGLRGPDGVIASEGPRVPLILISPYARTGAVVHSPGSQASVVKFADRLFDLPPLATLPDEIEGRKEGWLRLHQKGLGPEDATGNGIGDLSGAFDPDRLSGQTRPLSRVYAAVPQRLIDALPARTGYGCKAIGIIPVDKQNGIRTAAPADFNARPKTDPSAPARKD
ncbi:MAG TPA: alkaline phosphatase family protein [Beijerinckiaceae bacterium]|nr:alkaline phosphatase family protein [Beijerinckiaceae bacterium]